MYFSKLKTYQSVESPKVIASNLHSRLIDNLGGPKFTPIINLPPIISHPESDRPNEWIQNIPDNSTYN